MFYFWNVDMEKSGRKRKMKERERWRRMCSCSSSQLERYLASARCLVDGGPWSSLTLNPPPSTVSPRLLHYLSCPPRQLK